MPTYVVKRKADGHYYKNATKPRNAWKMTRDELAAAEENAHWTPDLQRARTYTNRGGAANTLPYKADRADYEFREVQLIEVSL